MSNINVEPPLTRGEQLRRVVRLCADFTRNLAYYRASLQYSTAWSLRTNDGAFWRTVHNNALDTCVLEWCKLFGGRNDQHSWRKIVSNVEVFESQLLDNLGTSVAEFDDLRIAMREYRDTFVAHLDVFRKMNIPKFDIAQKSVNFYGWYLAEHEDQAADLRELRLSALNLTLGYEQCKSEAEAVYSRLRIAHSL